MQKFFLMLCVLFLFAVGCSGGIDSPVSPTDKQAGTMDSVPVIDVSSYGDSFSAIGMMGAYELIINPDEMTADLIAKRTSAIGEGYIVSGISFFTMAPCTNCLNLSGIDIDMDNSYLTLTFSIEHPFQPGNPAEDPTAANRRDLDVFDLAMVIAPQDAALEAYPLTGVDAYANVCLDPDGYTKELQNVIGDNAALPYFLVVDDSVEGTATWNKFAMGATGEFDVSFLLTGSLTFDMYLTMGYGFSARRLQRLTPRYYNPEFNRNAAWKVEVIPPRPAELGSTWDDNDATTEYDVEVHVFNWQQGATVYAGTDFEEAPQDNIYASSDVASVSIEIPGMTDTLPTENVAVSGTGMPDDPLVYMFSIANENLLEPGQYPGLVKVTDERTPGAIGDRDFMIDTPDGILLNNYDLPEYVTYQVFMADVVLGCGPITGEIVEPEVPITGVALNALIDFTVIAESDNDGDPIVLYEVDYDYDGETFNAADSNTDGVFENVGPFTVPDPCEDNIPVEYTVAFRATDSCDPPNVTIFATTTVTVDTCLSAVGNVVITVNRLGAGQRFAFDSSAPWTLSWDAAGGAEEYAIYRDNDPTDGLDNNMEFIGTTTDTFFDVPGTELPANRWVVGNTYTVRSRGVAGDPGSETENSELAFITVNGWEALGGFTNPGWGNNGEGWLATSERYGTTAGFYFPYTRSSTTNSAHGSFNLQLYSYTIGADQCGQWQGVKKETPNVPDATVRFVEWASYGRGYFENGGAVGGFMIGTSSDQVDHPWNTPSDVTWAQAASDGDYFGYNANSSFVASTFDSVPTDQNNSWDFQSTGYQWRVMGGDVNDGGDPDDAYVAIVAARDWRFTSNSPYDYTDEYAIIIY